MIKLLFIITIINSGVVYCQTEQSAQDSIIEFVNCPAEFPGGSLELSKFIQHNFDYQDIDSTKFDFGTLFITFWVEKDGSLTSVDFTNRKKESILSKNAAPFKSMPNWTPACDRNGTIRERIWFPVIIDP